MVAKGLLLAVAGASAGRVWHLTDIHVDPVYQVNASTKAYCNGAVVADPALQAPVFGAPVGDCATPQRLYDSALGFMASQPKSDMVLFTGDFTQAGLRSEGPGDDSVLDTIEATHRALRAALPGVAVYGAVGNHDSYPGDVLGDPPPPPRSFLGPGPGPSASSPRGTGACRTRAPPRARGPGPGG